MICEKNKIRIFSRDGIPRTLVDLLLGIALLVHFPASASAERKTGLDIETIFTGGLSAPEPSELRWGPDGQRIGYFLPDGNGDRGLWVFDARTGEKMCAVSGEQARQLAPSPEQAAVGERERNRRIRYGVPSYLWAPDGNHILFVSSGRLQIFDLTAKTATVLAPNRTGLTDPRYSPDGKWISFVYEHDLWVVPAAGGREKRLTFGGSRVILHGEPDWVYTEEFDLRSGYRWSPDSKHIAYIELDERSVPLYPLIEQSSNQATVDYQIYPKAGDPNPLARVGIVNLGSRKTVWVDRSADYIPRFDWVDEHALALQLLNRAQNELEMIEANSRNGRSRTLLREKDSHWLEVTDNLTFLAEGRQFLWTSDRSGYHHIYLYGRDGNLIRQITSGDWVVRDIVSVDEPNGWIYYRSNQAETIGLNLFRIKMDGSGVERITKESGTHTISMNASNTVLVDLHSSMNRARTVTVRDLTGGKPLLLHEPRDLSELDLSEPEMQEVRSDDGAVIRLLLYKPRTLEPGRKYPVVVYVYGMPGAPTIQDAWAGNRGLFHQFLVQQGFLVAQIDDRSSSIPGHKNAVAAYGNPGPVAARDHELALNRLKSLPYVDGESVALWGWSGGGYTAVYHMTHTDLFRSAVAVAPVTDWRLYDSIYTERVLGLPDRQPDTYERASVVKAAGNFRGRLLLVHGTLDDNVHPQNTLQLADALIGEGKQFDLMLYPHRTHSFYGVVESVHLYSLIYEFLDRTLRRN